MSKTFKRFFAGLLAFVLVFAMTAIAAPKAEVKAEAEEYLSFIAIGADSAAGGWDMQYYNGTGADTNNVTGTTAMVSEGETVTISVVMPEEVATTWFVAPVIVAEGIEELDFTMNSITIDGEEVLDQVNMNAREAGQWWYEGTGDYTQAIRLAGGYNEWGDKFMAEGPKGYTELSFTYTLNKIEKAPEYLTFVAIGADSAAGGWDMQYYNGTGADTNNITGTTAMVSAGETVTVSVVMPEEVATTWFVAPVIVAEGIEELDFTMNSITIDGEEVLDQVNMDARAEGKWWYEGTGDYTQAIRLAGGYNEWGDKFMAEGPKGYTELSFTYTLNKIEKAPEYLSFVAIGADSAAGGWDMQYYNGTGADTKNIIGTNAMVSVGETVTVSVVMPEEVATTWFVAPVIVAEGVQQLNFTMNSITIDGEEVLDTVNMDARAEGKWWYEGTGDYAQAIRLAGGYNEWGDKFMAEGPKGYTELSFTYTLNSLSTEAAGGNVNVVELPDEFPIFVAIAADSTSGSWDMSYANESDYAGEVVATTDMISVGETVTVGLVMPNEVAKTHYMAPVLIAEGVGSMDVTVSSITLDGEEMIGEVDLNADSRGMWWYEGTGNYTSEQSIRIAGGYNDFIAEHHFAESPTGWTEVFYTITLNSIAPVAPTVSNEIVYTGDVTMFLASQAESIANEWNYIWTNNSAEDTAGITGNVVTAKAGDTVTLSLTYPETVVHTWWLSPVIALPEAEDGQDKYQVDYTLEKVTLDGVDITDKIDLTVGAASWYENAGSTWPVTRTIRLAGGYNEWGDQYVAGDVLEGYKTVEYTITLNKIYGEIVEEVEGPKVDKNGTYNAYFGIQTADSWVFRNAWDDATYGKDSVDNPDAFGQLSIADSTLGLVKKNGTITDTVISGNGTYSVSLSGFDLTDAAGEVAPSELNLLFFSTDIPNSGEITISNVKVDFDGKNVMEFEESFLDPDSKEWLKILCINIWNSGLKGSYPMTGIVPTSEIVITFDVSGFDYDKAAEVEPTPAGPTEAPAEPTVAPTEAPAEPTVAPTEAPAEPTAAPTEAPADVDADAEGGMSPLVIVIIVVAVIAVVGVAAFVVMKKKK